MATRRWKTGNSGTRVAIDDAWRVLDVGSGHHPHPRADVLLDLFFDGDNTSRSGQPILLGQGRPVCADALRMPFADGAFDFAVASHIAEHVPDPVALCRELARVSRRGYLETPSKFTETTRGAPYHLWYVSRRGSGLVFETATRRRRRGPLGWLYYHCAMFGRPWMDDSPLNVSNRPLRWLIRALGYVLRRLPGVLSKDVIYTRFHWDGQFEATRE